MSFLPPIIREDWREPRDWRRIWRDPAGFLGCCCTATPCDCPCEYTTCVSVTIPEAIASHGMYCVSPMTFHFRAIVPCEFVPAGVFGDLSCCRGIVANLYTQQPNCTLILNFVIDGIHFATYEAALSDLECSYPGTAFSLLASDDVVQWPSMLTLDVLDDTDCAPPSACCDPAFPDSMTLTFSNGGACPLYDGLTVTLNYDSGLGDWIGTISTPLPFCGFGPGFDEPNVLTYFVLTCFRGEPALWASLITGQDCGTAFAQASDGGTCSPINFTFSLTVASSGVCSCCADGTTLTATLTS